MIKYKHSTLNITSTNLKINESIISIQLKPGASYLILINVHLINTFLKTESHEFDVS